jgi:hypothetical protein
MMLLERRCLPTRPTGGPRTDEGTCYFSAIELLQRAPSGLTLLMVPVMLIPSLKSPQIAALEKRVPSSVLDVRSLFRWGGRPRARGRSGRRERRGDCESRAAARGPTLACTAGRKRARAETRPERRERGQRDKAQRKTGLWPVFRSSPRRACVTACAGRRAGGDAPHRGRRREGGCRTVSVTPRKRC